MATKNDVSIGGRVDATVKALGTDLIITILARVSGERTILHARILNLAGDLLPDFADEEEAPASAKKQNEAEAEADSEWTRGQYAS